MSIYILYIYFLSVKFVGHFQAFPQGSVLRKSANVQRTPRHYIYPLFCEGTWHFQILIYRLSCAQFYMRSVYTTSAILRAYFVFYA